MFGMIDDGMFVSLEPLTQGFWLIFNDMFGIIFFS